LLTRTARPALIGHALVIGNPVRDDPKFPPLPFAEAEAQDVATLLGEATVLVGADATVPRFLELAGNAGLIHFAGHGQFDIDQPLDSGLMFAQPDHTGVMLRARNLYELHSNASLAFLSACQTALGRTTAGQELIGLERGFFSAGVSSVIASLWEVHDQSTAMLAHEFYKALKQGAAPSRALQSAQLAVRHQYPQPVDWSGFVLASVGSE
jgi:CHAT domain-containing protein